MSIDLLIQILLQKLDAMAGGLNKLTSQIYYKYPSFA